tara:strand:- start:394 stop:1095 length:702 start_codon:yes stop_codon:yes gene_type:complete
MKKLYYNPSSATRDPRTGMGYGKSQKIPSMGTGLGSESMMGSSVTGIYVEPDEDIEEEEEEEGEFGFDTASDVDRFVNMINKKTVRADPAFWPRADRSSVGSSHSVMLFPVNEKVLPRRKGGPLPPASNTIAPFPSSVLYPKGFDGAPLGGGAANQAFRTTGNQKFTGTTYGASRAPIRAFDDQENFHVFNFKDLFDIDQSERSVIKQRIKIMKILNRINEIDHRSEKLLFVE